MSPWNSVRLTKQSFLLAWLPKLIMGTSLLFLSFSLPREGHSRVVLLLKKVCAILGLMGTPRCFLLSKNDIFLQERSVSYTLPSKEKKKNTVWAQVAIDHVGLSSNDINVNGIFFE